MYIKFERYIMNSKKCNLIFVLVLFSNLLYAQGKVVSDKFYSSSLDTVRAVNIYLPENYDSINAEIRYPVIYFLHGGGGDQNSYQLIIPILDSLIINHIIDPLIVVKPDGSSKPYISSKWLNSDLYGDFEDFIVNDLVNYIDSKYKTIPFAKGRCIMGHSGGGEGAMRIALKHPDIYTGVASHSGILSGGFLKFLTPLILAENDSSDLIKPTAGFLSKVLFTAAGGYSPNMNNPPYYVDLPIDNKGRVIDSVYTRWKFFIPSYLASLYNPKDGLDIYFDCGTNDPILKYTNVFADTLSTLKIPFVFQTFEGGHTDQLGKRLPISIKYLNSVLSKEK